MAMPYFIELYTDHKYDWVNKVPLTANPDDFVLPSQMQSLFTSILSLGTFFGALMRRPLRSNSSRGLPNLTLRGILVFAPRAHKSPH